MPGRSKSVLEIATKGRLPEHRLPNERIGSRVMTTAVTTSKKELGRVWKKVQGPPVELKVPKPRTPAEIRKMLRPKESQSQQAIFRHFLGDLKGDRKPGIGLTSKYPDLLDLYAVPNQGGRSPANGARMKAEGMFKSIPDMCLPAPRGPFHGLYLEGKREGEKLRPDQAATAGRLRARGYCVATWQSAAEGIRAILWYLELGPFRFPIQGLIDEVRETLHHTLELRLKDVTR